jgi:hypothetical protein
MKSQIFPIIINLVAAVFGAFGQYSYKIGAARLKYVPIYLNWQIAVGVGFFTVVMVMMIIGFKFGGRLSVCYPVYATTFLWGTLIGVKLDNEPWAGPQVIGILLVVIGVSIVAFWAPKT